jgi:hypothetical protein
MPAAEEAAGYASVGVEKDERYVAVARRARGRLAAMGHEEDTPRLFGVSYAAGVEGGGARSRFAAFVAAEVGTGDVGEIDFGEHHGCGRTMWSAHVSGARAAGFVDAGGNNHRGTVQ